MACAALAGLASGLVAGGIVVALHGTPWGLLFNTGDTGGWMAQWVGKVLAGEPLPNHYPPFSIYALSALTYFGDQPYGYALKDFEIFVTALYGPAAYLGWRMLLRPLPALLIGTVTMLPFIEPYKPFTMIVLVLIFPVFLKFLLIIRHAANLSAHRSIVLGSAAGLAFGVMFMTYSGWFVWAAPGAIAAVLLVVPWRTGLKMTGIFLLSTTVVFLAISFQHLIGLLSPTGGAEDTFTYFDTFTDPAYIAMWRDNVPGDSAIGAWPPAGELGGVGVFTLLLAAGLGLAIAVGWRRLATLAIGLLLTGAWLTRQLIASWMYETGLVRLYPRTTMFILLGLLLLAGFGAVWTWAFLRPRLAGWPIDSLGPDSPESDRRSTQPNGADGVGTETYGEHPDHNERRRVRRVPAAPVALLLIPLMFIFASAGSALSDRFMPSQNPDDRGFFAWDSQTSVLPNGDCPAAVHGHPCG